MWKMNLKAGMKVKVRHDIMNTRYPDCDNSGSTLHANYAMVAMKGKVLTIEYIDMRTFRFAVKENDWMWNPNMVQPISNFNYLLTEIKSE